MTTGNSIYLSVVERRRAAMRDGSRLHPTRSVPSRAAPELAAKIIVPFTGVEHSEPIALQMGRVTHGNMARREPVFWIHPSRRDKSSFSVISWFMGLSCKPCKVIFCGGSSFRLRTFEGGARKPSRFANTHRPSNSVTLTVDAQQLV